MTYEKWWQPTEAGDSVHGKYGMDESIFPGGGGRTIYFVDTDEGRLILNNVAADQVRKTTFVATGDVITITYRPTLDLEYRVIRA
jgi:hypothetical protein